MRASFVIWALAALLAGACGVAFLHRVMSPDMVAVSFAEGGDDAYYFFTVARNIAQGKGITIDGVHWTTGFQPLWGFVCALPFLAGSDRAALFVIYLISLALWLTGALLFVRLLRRASITPVPATAVALVVVVFLGETQFLRGYFNGMETGLYLDCLLLLLIAFHDYLAVPADRVSLRRVAALGGLAGLTMLARNDALFVCGALLATTLFFGRRRTPVRDIAIVISIGSAMVLPWLIYCQWASGNPLPQSGIATSVAVRGYVPLKNILGKIVASIDPIGFLKIRAVIDDHLFIAAAATAIVAIALAFCWRRDRPLLTRPGTCVLAALAVGTACLLLYYPLVSSAGQFFERYFLPLKLLIFLLVAMLVARMLAQPRWPTVANIVIVTVAAATVGSNLYWISRDYGRPYLSHMGPETYDIVRSRYATDNSRIGMAESGRIAFLYPTRVVNLDGKMNVEALRAVLSGTLDRYIQSANLDYLMLHIEDVGYFDKTMPTWRNSWQPRGKIGEFDVFGKTP
jgi:hypothetical protein